MGGAFQMSREIFNHGIWTDIPKFRIFFYIVGNAVFSKEGVKKGNVFIGRGQYLRSYRKLSKDLAYIEKNAEKEYSTSVIQRKVKDLVEEGALQTEETELGTLFTVVNYHLYQDLNNYQGDRLEQQKNSKRTPEEQQKNNNKKVKEGKEEKTSLSKRNFKYEEHHMKLAELLRKGVVENNKYPKDANLESWANDIRIMMDKGCAGKDIQDVILFTQQDPFWKTNIQSASKLKDQFSRLHTEMVTKKGQSQEKLAGNSGKLVYFKPDTDMHEYLKDG